MTYDIDQIYEELFDTKIDLTLSMSQITNTSLYSSTQPNDMLYISRLSKKELTSSSNKGRKLHRRCESKDKDDRRPPNTNPIYL